MTERIVDRAALPSTSPRAPLTKGEHGVLAKGRLPADSLLSFRPSEAVSRARGEISERQRRTRGYRPRYAVRFLDCARNDREGESTDCVFPLLSSAFSPLLSFRPKHSFLPNTRAKPWLLRERGAATKRSCKARLRGLLRAQCAETSAWSNLGASATDKRQSTAQKKRALTYYVKARYRCSTLLRQKNCPLCSLTGRVPRGIDPTVQHGCRQRIPVQRTGENFQPTVLPLCRRGI